MWIREKIDHHLGRAAGRLAQEPCRWLAAHDPRVPARGRALPGALAVARSKLRRGTVEDVQTALEAMRSKEDGSGSLPHDRRPNTDAQREQGVFDRSIMRMFVLICRRSRKRGAASVRRCPCTQPGVPQLRPPPRTQQHADLALLGMAAAERQSRGVHAKLVQAFNPAAVMRKRLALIGDCRSNTRKGRKPVRWRCGRSRPLLRSPDMGQRASTPVLSSITSTGDRSHV